MALTDAGRDFITTAIMNSGPPTFFDNTNSYIAVGTSTQVYASTDTTLVAEIATTGRQGMEATYPLIASNVLTFRSIFATGDANDTWQEWGILNASTGGTLLSRLVEDLGTKTSAQTWQITVAITVAVGI